MEPDHGRMTGEGLFPIQFPSAKMGVSQLLLTQFQQASEVRGGSAFSASAKRKDRLRKGKKGKRLLSSIAGSMWGNGAV
jgi:hypothetical protein